MLQAVKDNSLLNKLVVHEKKILIQSYTTHCINIKKKDFISRMYLNKMIVIHVTDTNYAMHWRIWQQLTSKRKAHHALLFRQGYTITLYLDAMTYSMSVISIHLSVVTWMKQIYTPILISKLSLKNQIHKLNTLINPSTSSDILNSSNLFVPPKSLI